MPCSQKKKEIRKEKKQDIQLCVCVCVCVRLYINALDISGQVKILATVFA